MLCESNSRVRISLMSVFIFAILPTGPNKISLQHLTVRNPPNIPNLFAYGPNGKCLFS